MTAGPILDAWMYYIDVADKHVFIVTYGCISEDDSEPVLSHEHKENSGSGPVRSRRRSWSGLQSRQASSSTWCTRTGCTRCIT